MPKGRCPQTTRCPSHPARTVSRRPVTIYVHTNDLHQGDLEILPTLRPCVLVLRTFSAFSGVHRRRYRCRTADPSSSNRGAASCIDVYEACYRLLHLESATSDKSRNSPAPAYLSSWVRPARALPWVAALCTRMPRCTAHISVPACQHESSGGLWLKQHCYVRSSGGPWCCSSNRLCLGAVVWIFGCIEGGALKNWLSRSFVVQSPCE